MKVRELIENLQATDDMEKEVCIDIGGTRYTVSNRLLGYENHVDVLANERYKGNDFFNFDNPFSQDIETQEGKV